MPSRTDIALRVRNAEIESAEIRRLALDFGTDRNVHRREAERLLERIGDLYPADERLALSTQALAHAQLAMLYQAQLANLEASESLGVS